MTLFEMSAKRRSYETTFKLKVAEFAEKHGNRPAGREFSVSEKIVRDCRKQKEVLQEMPKSMSASRPGGKPHWPELERKLLEWVQENRKNGIGLCGMMVRVKEMDLHDFTGNPTWLYCFMRRHDLVLCQRTRLGKR